MQTVKTNAIAAFAIALSIAAATFPAHAGADFKWWATGQTSGQINLTNASGTQRQSLPSNPTGAQTVRSANTQAPTVVVQATNSLPIKSIGDTCTPTGSPTTAAEGTAITADRIMLLTCNAAISAWIPARVYANESDACNIIYKTTTYAVGDRLTLSAALPSGTIASNSTGLTLSCQSGVWRSTEKLLVLSGTVETTNCSSWYWWAQRICMSFPFNSVVFPEQFSTPPKIIASPSRNFPYTTCPAGAADAQDYSVTGISTAGFTIYGGASPAGGCGDPYNSGRTTSTYEWIAVGTKN